MKATATAPANIAFVKYWGKRDGESRLPLNDSLSMALDAATTTTTVDFDAAFESDEVSIDGTPLTDAERARIVRHLDRVRNFARIATHARVVTRNAFPMGAGLASSASGFAALSLAASSSAGLVLPERELTILARMGSGSAARSVPGGFALWHASEDPDGSYAERLFSHDHWGIRDVIAIVSSGKKKVGSTQGMDRAATSPFLSARLAAVPGAIARATKAIAERDFTALGEVIEAESFSMHAVMQTQSPHLLYWSPATVAVLHAVFGWRGEGIAAYATIDAGPNVHVICRGEDVADVEKRLSGIAGVERTITCAPAPGARLLQEHLF